MASIILTLVAAPIAVGGILALLHWRAPAQPWPADAAKPLLDLPLLRTVPAAAIGLICWLAAWSLHLYASRRRRMPLPHAVVPAVLFVASVILAFFVPPPASHS